MFKSSEIIEKLNLLTEKVDYIHQIQIESNTTTIIGALIIMLIFTVKGEIRRYSLNKKLNNITSQLKELKKNKATI